MDIVHMLRPLINIVGITCWAGITVNCISISLLRLFTSEAASGLRRKSSASQGLENPRNGLDNLMQLRIWLNMRQERWPLAGRQA